MRLPLFLVFAFASFLPMLSFGQPGKYVLNGNLHLKDGTTYPYKLVFDVNNGDIKGYSITKIPDGTETKAGIKGHINRKKQTVSITEIQLLSESQKDVTYCMLEAKMVYKLKGTNYFALGTFSGKDENKKPCGEGVIEFQQANTTASIFYTDTTPKAPIVIPDTLAKSELPGTENRITAGVQKQYDWTSDSCVIDIWDGGVIDGDIISILVNGKAVLSNYTLAKEKKQLRFRLPGQLNTIAIVAEDEGVNPPNTAQIILADGDIHYKVTAFNKKGEKAVVIIRKR